MLSTILIVLLVLFLIGVLLPDHTAPTGGITPAMESAYSF